MSYRQCSKNYSYLSFGHDISHFRPMLDVQEHMWKRKQKENQIIKFDRKITDISNHRMNKQLDHNLHKYQREKLLFKRQNIDNDKYYKNSFKSDLHLQVAIYDAKATFSDQCREKKKAY